MIIPSIDKIYPILEPGDAVLTPGFVSNIEDCFLPVVPAYFHFLDLLRLLEITVTHNRVFVPRVATSLIASDRGGVASLFQDLAELGVVKFFYPAVNILGTAIAGSMESKPYTSIDEFWTHEKPAARIVFGLGFESVIDLQVRWHNAYFSLGQALLTTRPDSVDATAVWGNTFFAKDTSIFSGPRQCYNQGYIARMTPVEFEAAVKSGKLKISESGKVDFGNELYSHPNQCIEQNKYYWEFLNRMRRICIEEKAVLYHSAMEAPFVQLMETEFDELEQASGRSELYANTVNIKDFKSIYSDWVAQYRAKWSVGHTLVLPPLAQRVLLETPRKLETFTYELHGESEHCLKELSCERQVNCLASGIETTRRQLKAFRELNTDAVIALAESQLEGRIDLAKYESARRRFVEALDTTTKDSCIPHRIVDAKLLMECIIECCSLNPSGALSKIAQRLGEILGLSCGLHFGSANVLSGIAAKVEHPERTFRDVFGEVSFQARCELENPVISSY